MQKEHLTPAAILVGSVIIGLGLYFGLQGKEPGPEPAPAGAAPEQRPGAAAPRAAGEAPAAPAALLKGPAAAPAAPDVAPGPGLGAAAPGELAAKVHADVEKALEARRRELVDRCWTPSAKKAPEPKQAKYIYDMTFDAAGKPLARGISEIRGMERSDTAQCLREMPMDLEVPPPGAVVSVKVDFTLP